MSQSYLPPLFGASIDPAAADPQEPFRRAKLADDNGLDLITLMDHLETGLTPYTITQLGVQTLTVSADNPLLLFNLDISLEWDARYDKAFQTQLETDLRRTSEMLYDWTNGQAALGQIKVYHNREKWNEAHIRIYASNQVRPSAEQGGIISTTDVLTVTNPPNPDVAYSPGQVWMGSVWNRYGAASSGNLAEDWPRILAHELGHYLFFLDDNYLGTDAEGLVVSIKDCPGAMSDPYRDDYTEFLSVADWQANTTCKNSFSKRADWETIHAFYPSLISPTTLMTDEKTNQGPGNLPLAVTQVQFKDPDTPSSALEVPIFYLKKPDGSIYESTSLNSRAFLFQTAEVVTAGSRLIDLGTSTTDRVLARGARSNDRVCLFDLLADQPYWGCETIRAGDEQLQLQKADNWQPQVIISPVTSHTIAITVENIVVNMCKDRHPVCAGRTITLQKRVLSGILTLRCE